MIIKLLLVFGVLIVVALTTLAILRRRDDRKVDGIWQSLEVTSAHQVFTEDMVSDLPGPARRYLLHAIRPDTPLASSVSLEMRGTMRLKPEQEWMPMKARQILAPPKGFVWRAEAGNGLMRFSGGQVQEERSFGGYTIPSKVGVGWWIGTDRYFEFFRAQVEDAVFRSRVNS